MPRGLNERAANVELGMHACGMAQFLQLHLYPVNLVGMVLLFSSMASCADARGGRVESPIRLFFSQQIPSELLWKGYGEDCRVFPLLLDFCCLPLD